LEIKHRIETQITKPSVHLPQPLDPLFDQGPTKYVPRLYLEIGCRLIVRDEGRSCNRDSPQPVQRTLADRDDKSYREGSGLFSLVLRVNVFDPRFVDVRCQVTVVGQDLPHSRKVCRQFRGVIDVAPNPRVYKTGFANESKLAAELFLGKDPVPFKSNCRDSEPLLIRLLLGGAQGQSTQEDNRGRHDILLQKECS